MGTPLPASPFSDTVSTKCTAHKPAYGSSWIDSGPGIPPGPLWHPVEGAAELKKETTHDEEKADDANPAVCSVTINETNC
jgi:hypothetical protein